MDSGENGVIGLKNGAQNTTIQLAQKPVIHGLIMTFLWQQAFPAPLLHDIPLPFSLYDQSLALYANSLILHFYFVHTSNTLLFRPIKHLFLHSKGYPIHKSTVSKSSFRGARGRLIYYNDGFTENG